MCHQNDFVVKLVLRGIIYGYAFAGINKPKTAQQAEQGLIISDSRYTECSNLTQTKS